MSVAEACDAIDRITDACDEAGGHVAGGILYPPKKPTEGGDDGDQE